MLKELYINYCLNLTDSGLRNLQSLDVLQKLNISGLKQISDQRNQFPNVFHTINSLGYIGKLITLKDLNISSCVKLKDTGLFHLRLFALITKS